MGGTCCKDYVVTNDRIKKISDKSFNNSHQLSNIILSLDPKFKDMPEWDGDRYKGEGIKRMRGYICDLQIDKLNELRDEFWSNKIKERLIWRQLRQAVYMDDSIYIFINLITKLDA
jgi:hypothetical protein